jgi:hypothetical protein
MEDILDIYSLPYDKNLPVICMDEKPLQLLGEKRAPLPMQPGSCTKIDSEYTRQGTCSIFLFTEPLGGWRYVAARMQRTKQDWAQEVKELLTVYYPDAPKVILIADNLNTHVISSFYETFDPEEARNLARRIEFHYTPKHGSWLNIAEIELSALTSQCLDRRISDIVTLNHELQKWQIDRNACQKGVSWQFTTKDARIKLKRLYPEISML